MKKILGVIPARGGSKGIPDKNIYIFNAKPLIAYTIEAGLKSKLLSDMIVSTDSQKIKEVAVQYGAKVPFMRPEELSNGSALAIPTIQHAVAAYEEIVGFKYDYIIMLQPTAPLRCSEDIDNALQQLIDKDADGIISVVDVDNYHPLKMKVIKDDYLYDFIKSDQENPPRQELPPVYIVNGAIYATKRNVLMDENTFKGERCLPYVMQDDKSVNIDKISDIIIADYYLNK